MTLILFFLAFIPFVIFFLNLLPVYSGLPAGFSTALVSLVHILWGFNLIFPVPTLFTVLGIALIYHFNVYLYHLISMLVRWIRGGTS